MPPQGRTIRERRESAGLSQDDLGALLSVHPNRIDEWEWGEAAPNPVEEAGLRVVLDLDGGGGTGADVVVELLPAEAGPGRLPLLPASPKPLGVPPRPEQPPPLPTPPEANAGREPAVPRSKAGPASAGVMTTVGAAILIALLVAAGVLLLRQQQTADAVNRAAAWGRAAALLRRERDELAARLDALGAEAADAGHRAEQAEAAARIRIAPVVAGSEAPAAGHDLRRTAAVIGAGPSEVDAVAPTIGGGADAAMPGYVLDVRSGREIITTFFPTRWFPVGHPGVGEWAVAEEPESGSHPSSGSGIGDMTAAEVPAGDAAGEEAVPGATGAP